MILLSLQRLTSLETSGRKKECKWLFIALALAIFCCMEAKKSKKIRIAFTAEIVVCTLIIQKKINGRKSLSLSLCKTTTEWPQHSITAEYTFSAAFRTIGTQTAT